MPDHPFGPPALGRGAVVKPGQPAPPELATADRVVVDDDALESPNTVAQLRRAYVSRTPVVVELQVDQAVLKAPVAVTPPALHRLGTVLPIVHDDVRFLVWANNVDCRDEPRWWHAELAVRAGLERSQRADVVVDGHDVWVDGGPRSTFDFPVLHRESIGVGSTRLAPVPSDPAGIASVMAADLASDQTAAVTHRSGPARIVAPAGSGKTRVLTARLRHLLLDRRIEPALVTAVAYNTRAAAQMRERTSDLQRVNIRTIHSLALWICNQVTSHTVLEERDVRSILERELHLGRVPNKDPYQPYLEALTDVRLALRDPATIESERDDVDGLSELIPRYRRQLRDRNQVDFDEQIVRAIELLLERPNLRAEVQRRCTHLLVDEFQDLTPAMFLLVQLVAGPSQQVFAVGDDDQTIYSYAGATPDFLLRFEDSFPGFGDHPLEVNYRCPPAVVTATGHLLTHNRRRIAKTIRSGQPADSGGSDALTVHRVSPANMASRAASLVAAALSDGVPTTEIAVLARVSSALLPVQVTLHVNDVATTSPVDRSVLRRTGIASALAYLRMALDPDRIQRADIMATLNRPPRKVKSAVTPLLRQRGRWTLDDLVGLTSMLEGKAQQRWSGYVDDLGVLARAVEREATTFVLMKMIRDQIGLGRAMERLDASTSRPEGSSHGDDLDALEQLALLHDAPLTFHTWLADHLERSGRDDGVTLSTVHRVKGREWDRVIVQAADQGLFPHRLSEDVEEERRVFHVAITRCRRRVDVIANAERPSPFTSELDRPAPANKPRISKPKVPPKRPAIKAVDLDDEDRSCFEVLRGWRRREASDRGIPAYTIFQDRTLASIAEVRPATRAELAALPGIGPAKLDKYGDAVLELVAACDD